MAYWPNKGKKKHYNNVRSSGNPFFNRPKVRSRISGKAKLVFFLIISCFGFLIWAFFISGLFFINSIEVAGHPEELKNIILEKSWEQSHRPRLGVFKQNNLWAFDKSGLIAELNSGYTFEELKIKKRPFHKIIISFIDKKSSFVWKEGDKYYYIDDKGAVIKEADPLNIKADNAFLVENRGDARAEDKSLEEEEIRLGYIKQLDVSLKAAQEVVFTVERYIVDNDTHTVKAALKEGPEIFFNSEAEAGTQLNRLITLIKDKLKDDYKNKKYIDLRFGELIYFQ